MEMNFVLNGNKLIAEFMEESEWFAKNMAIYHKSWDSLIPVMSKIQSLEPFKHSSLSVEQFKRVFSIENSFEDFVRIEKTYKKIIEFIKWYNKHS